MIELEDNSDAKNEITSKTTLKKTLTNSEILSQALLFLIGGYETTASTLEFVAYNLATHSSVQAELCEEIDRVTEKYVTQA
jgi:cytochrome P450